LHEKRLRGREKKRREIGENKREKEKE